MRPSKHTGIIYTRKVPSFCISRPRIRLPYVGDVPPTQEINTGTMPITSNSIDMRKRTAKLPSPTIRGAVLLTGISYLTVMTLKQSSAIRPRPDSHIPTVK